MQSTGPGKIYRVSFKRQNGTYFGNYVHVRRSDLRAYDPVVCKDGRELAKGLRFGILSAGDPNTTIRNPALSAISVILVLTIAIISVWSATPPLEPLIAFAGLVIGYLAGKAA